VTTKTKTQMQKVENKSGLSTGSFCYRHIEFESCKKNKASIHLNIR